MHNENNILDIVKHETLTELETLAPGRAVPCSRSFIVTMTTAAIKLGVLLPIVTRTE